MRSRQRVSDQSDCINKLLYTPPDNGTCINISQWYIITLYAQLSVTVHVDLVLIEWCYGYAYGVVLL